MKTCDEMVRDLLARRDRYDAEQKQKRAAVLHTAAALCCVCLMVLIGVGVRQAPPRQTTEDTAAHGTAETGAVLSAVSSCGDTTAAPATTADTAQISLVEADEIPAPMRALFGLMVEDFTVMDDEALNAYYGINVFPAVPDDLQRREQALGIYRRAGETGEVYWDGNALSYANVDGSRWVSVNVDKDVLPFDFCNLFADVNARSVIGGIEVGLAQDADGVLFAEFTVGGVGFRIIAGGLTPDELVNIVRTLLA